MTKSNAIVIFRCDRCGDPEDCPHRTPDQQFMHEECEHYYEYDIEGNTCQHKQAQRDALRRAAKKARI